MAEGGAIFAGEADLATLYTTLKRTFREAGIATPDLDARLLVTDTLKVTTAQLVASPRARIAPDLVAELERRARERLAGRSIGRILGRRAFWSLDLRLSDATLEPRPETETVVEAALSFVEPDAAGLVADLGVGTGAILLAVLTERPRLFGIGVDISLPCLMAARRNAERCGLADRTGFVAADFGAPLAGAFDLVVSNPPYIKSATIGTLDKAVREYDPKLALDGGADGLDAYRRVFAQARSMLRPGGMLVVEIDPAAKDGVLAEADRHTLDVVEIADDLTGSARAVSLRQSVV